jgi:hypothetical protein
MGAERTAPPTELERLCYETFVVDVEIEACARYSMPAGDGAVDLVSACAPIEDDLPRLDCIRNGAQAGRHTAELVEACTTTDDVIGCLWICADLGEDAPDAVASCAGRPEDESCLSQACRP